MCLENLTASRGSQERRRTLGAEWVENELVKVAQRRGEESLNALRDEAKELAPKLGLEKEFALLTKLVSAILNTHPVEGVLQTRLGVAQAKGEPFDQFRLQRFQDFADYLKQLNLSGNPYSYGKSSWRNISFFESYFSNYIEGTEFTIEEAEEIVFEKKTIPQRHEDSHDVLAHMEISGDVTEMHKLPGSSVELIDMLKIRHGLLLAERPDKRPGKFKERVNRAGGTDFVLPEHIEGTLAQGFEIYQTIPAGMQRALFIHFLVAECHPFDDGNGRISRIMMNAELVYHGQFKIIIPTVHRESYLSGLRKATREGRFRTLVKVHHQLQCYVSSLSWEDYGQVKSDLQEHAADKEPDEGVTIFNKVLSKLGGDYPSD
jgi:fido (protein-threonine AMPylation protein)